VLFLKEPEVTKMQGFSQRVRGHALFRRLAHVFGRRRPAFSDPYLAWLADAMAEDRRAAGHASGPSDE
jgi:hypothetical protein